MKKAEEFKIVPEILELFIESISRQTATEPADDLMNKMGMLNEFCKGAAEAHATEVNREDQKEILNELIQIKEYMQNRNAFHGYGQINDLITELQQKQEGE